MLPMCCTDAHASFAQISACSASRASRSMPASLTLISSWALSERSISLATASERPLPAMVTTGLLAFIGAWNEFLFALTFTSTEQMRTVPVAIGLLSGASAQEIPWGPIMSASVIVTVPLIVLVLIFQRKIVAGLTAGGVKG